MSWRDVVLKFDEREAASRVQKTGYCRRCQQMVTKYQRCNLTLPAPPIKPSCPMREMDSSERKAAMAITTTSAPSMFNNKAIRRKKKKKEDWA